MGTNIYKTIDSGKTFISVYNAGIMLVAGNNQTIVLRDLQFVNPSFGFAVGAFGRLLRTTDGGQNWAFVRATPKVGIVQFVDADHGWLIAGLWDYPVTNRLLQTIDGGLTWSEVKLPKWTDDK